MKNIKVTNASNKKIQCSTCNLKKDILWITLGLLLLQLCAKNNRLHWRAYKFDGFCLPQLQTGFRNSVQGHQLAVGEDLTQKVRFVLEVSPNYLRRERRQ